MTRIVPAAVGRRLPAPSTDRKVEILGVAGAGKSTVARMLSLRSGFEMADFIHTRKPSHLIYVARSLPRLLPILAAGITRRPRISWPEIKLLVYVTQWRRFLRRQEHRPGSVSLFDQGPLYALVRLKAEGKPFTTSRPFQRWREAMQESWASELDAVIWLDAPDAVLWTRINERPQGHKKKGEETEAGHSFIADYRRGFDEILHAMEELHGPEVLRFDTSIATAEQIADAISASVPVQAGSEGDAAAAVPRRERHRDGG